MGRDSPSRLLCLLPRLSPLAWIRHWPKTVEGEGVRYDPEASNNDPDFLDYYASVLEREATVRGVQNCDWMVAGAERARKRAAELRIPKQGDLFSDTANRSAA